MGTTNETHMKKHLLSILGILILGLSSAWPAAVVVFSDDFESLSLANWTTTAGSPLTIATQNIVPAGGQYSARMDVSTDRMHRNIIADNGGAELSGHIVFTAWIYDQGTNSGMVGATRIYNEIRGYSAGSGLPNGGTVASGALAQLLAAGKFNSVTLPGEVFTTTKYQGRVAFGPGTGGSTGWFNLNGPGSPNRSVGWHRFDIEVLPSGTDINFYVDGILSRTFAGATAETYDTLMLGPGLGTQTGDAWIDGISVVKIVPDTTTGRLVCPTGAPLAGCQVRVEFRDSGGAVIDSANTTTDSTGKFEVTLNCANSTGTGTYFYITSPCCGHPWSIASPRCSGDLGALICQECRRPCLPPPPGMVDWWTFDETISPAVMVANDIAGGVNNFGVHVNGPTPVAGKVNAALCFNGANQWVEVRDHAEVNFFGNCFASPVPAEDFSVDTWVRIDANTTEALLPIVDKRVNPQNPVGYTMFIAGGRLAFQMADGAGVDTYVEPSPSITPGEWHLVAVTVKRCLQGGGTLYVDGKVVLNFDPRRGSIANDSNLFIGRRVPAFGDVFLRGCLDELEFFKRALTPAEVQALYEADSAGKCRPCVAIRCPEDIRVWTCASEVKVDYDVQVINTCNSNVTVKCTPPSGSSFPVGIHNVICELNDPAGNPIDRCSFTVTVIKDTTPPEIQCPSNMVVYVCSPNGGVVDYTVNVHDDCDTNVTLVCTPPPGTFLPPGDHLVTCRAFDDCQNTSGCEFKLTVKVDAEPPRIICPDDIRRGTCDSNAVVVTYTVTATDDSGVVSVVCNPPSGSLFPVGTTQVICRAVDRCDREARCEFKVVIVPDTEPPRLDCPETIVAIACHTNATVVDYVVGVTDDTDPTPTLVCNPPSGSLFTVGSHVVRCTAVDNCKHTNTCSFKVEVVADNDPPRIICPDDIRRWVCTSNAIVDYTVVATDDSGFVTVVCNPPSGSSFPVGTTVVDCRAIDRCQNVSRCEFKVTIIQDTEPPRLVCPDDIRVWTCQPNGQDVKYDVTATDDCDTNVTVICVPPSGSFFPIGTTTVTCRAFDDCQHESRCEFRVTVLRDIEPPRITCPSNINVVTTCTNVAQISYTVTATDNADTNVAITCVPPSGSYFPAGVTTVTCTAVDDCGNRSECSFTVRVRYVQPPKLTIHRLDRGLVAVCWPVSAPGFQLQCAPHLNPPGPPFTWVDVPGAPVIIDGEYCVIFDTTEARHRFYRLRCAGVVPVDSATGTSSP